VDTYPTCDGPCPIPGDVCQINAAAQACFCGPPPPVECNLSNPPACDGVCPIPTDICVENTDGTGCFCEPPPPVECEDSFPACDGTCPPNEVCLQNAAGTACFCEPVPPPQCSDSYPACDGVCPLIGQVCVENDTLPGGCHCETPPPPVCAQAPFPQCGGLCPVNSACRPRFFGNDCLCCPTWTADPVDGVHFQSKAIIKWIPFPWPCARYHIYVLTAAVMPDLDDDGVADHYGDCFAHDLEVAESAAPGDPQPNQVHFIQITAENDGTPEGSMGAASNGLPRPNYSPCP
jgi:hypothetical protein